LLDDRLPVSSRRFWGYTVAVLGVLALAIPSIADSAGGITRQAETVRKLEAEISGLDARFGQASASYEGARSRLELVRGRIVKNTDALEKATAEFKEAQGLLAFRLSAVYRQPQPTGLEVLLRSGSLSDALSRVDVLDRVQRQDAKIVTRISAARDRMKKARAELLSDQAVAKRESSEARIRLTEVRSIRSARRGVLISAQRRLSVMITTEVNRQRRAALVAARTRVVRQVASAGGGGPASTPAATPVAAPVSAPVAPVSSGGGDVSAALRKIALCESGGNPSAVSPSGLYRGKYQFDPQTWQALGGSGDPAQAPEAEQDRIAGTLYGQRGAAPWPICGR
jgi:peptidoglycan hydrolase CwlO-like protein